MLGCGAPTVEPLPEPSETIFEGSALGTRFSVKIAADLDPLERQRATTLIGGELERVDSLLSTYRPESEISRFNRHRDGEPFELSPQTTALLSEAQRISAASDGAFDVTVGPLVDLWGFGPDRGDDAPSADEVAATLPRVGWRNLALDLEAGTATKAVAGLEVDLSAIGKGHAVDRVAEALAAAGWVDLLVEIGGEIRASGLSGRQEPWRVGIEEPNPAGSGVVQRIGLRDLAMATSGDYRNFYVVDGRRVSHTIDPRSGGPVTHSGASVTVLAERCSEADAWATALLVLGPEEGLRLAEELGLAALFLTYEAGGSIGQAATLAFDRLVAEG